MSVRLSDPLDLLGAAREALADFPPQPASDAKPEEWEAWRTTSLAIILTALTEAVTEERIACAKVAEEAGAKDIARAILQRRRVEVEERRAARRGGRTRKAAE